jgi:hypothetical protein
MVSIRIASCNSPRPRLPSHPCRRLDHAQRDIAFGLAQQAVADHAAGHLVAFGAGERRVVDDERHRYRRRIDRLRHQRRLDRGIAEGVGDRALGEARDGDDVAGFGFIQRRALDAAEGEDLGDTPCSMVLPSAPSTFTLLVRLDRAGVMRPVMMRPR